VQALRRVCEPLVKKGHTYCGLNFLAAPDQTFCEHLVRGEFLISGVRNKELRTLTGRTTALISHALKRLRIHGLLKRIAHTYKYYFTTLGRRVILAGLKLKTLVLIPALTEHRAAA
jgi:hypothetical protein